MLEDKYTEEHKYLLAKKRVGKIKGFYWHLIVFVVVNCIISGTVVFGLMKDGSDSFSEAINNFGVYSTWIFWGIGLFFHWLGVFGVNIFFSKNWEQKKIQQYLDDKNR